MPQTAAQETVALTTPAAGTWDFDVAHSSVGFVAKHLMVAKTRGRFERFGGTVTIGENPDASSVDVTIDASSIDTGNETRDGHLVSPDFLDVEKYPTIHYRSTSVEQTGEDSLRIQGELTIRDVTLPVELRATYDGSVVDPWGREHAVFTAKAEIDREAFGMTWNQALETGGVLVGRKVGIEIEVELIPRAE
jgi:polyisoprenoid-binding protein YceI